MSHIRTFIAIDLPPSIQESLAKQTTRLHQEIDDYLVRWVPVQNLHLTLKFLGNIPASHLDFIKRMLAQAAEPHTKFDLQLGGLGAFPTSNRPRVLWVGIHAPGTLASLQKAVDEGAARLGYEKDTRPFSPHLTLGRVRESIGSRELQKISATLAAVQLGKIGTVRVDSVHLYQSDLDPKGSIYTKLFSTPLR